MLFSLYTCKEALQRLEDYLDRELSPKEIQLVERHLKICHQCTKKFTFEANLLEAVRVKVQKVALPEGLKDRVKQSLQLHDES